jgi:hypothetical protein
LQWKKTKKADGYIIYQAACSKKLKQKAIITANQKTTYTFRNCKSDTFYKCRVAAYRIKNGTREIFARGAICHCINETAAGKYTNAKAVTVAKNAFTMKLHAKKKIIASLKKENASKKFAPKAHCDNIRYFVSNKKALVIKKGVITAKKTGIYHVYVLAPSGVSQTITITVKKK